MNVCYYIDKIRDETSGACEYYHKAIEVKADHPDHASMYAKMAETELEHAATLLKMFEDEYKKCATNDPIYPQIRSSILSMYSDEAAHVKSLQNTYTNK